MPLPLLPSQGRPHHTSPQRAGGTRGQHNHAVLSPSYHLLRDSGAGASPLWLSLLRTPNSTVPEAQRSTFLVAPLSSPGTHTSPPWAYESVLGCRRGTPPGVGTFTLSPVFAPPQWGLPGPARGFLRPPPAFTCSLRRGRFTAVSGARVLPVLLLLLSDLAFLYTDYLLAIYFSPPRIWKRHTLCKCIWS